MNREEFIKALNYDKEDQEELNKILDGFDRITPFWGDCEIAIKYLTSRLNDILESMPEND